MAIEKFGILFVLIGFCALIHARNSGDTLILVDNLAVRETHSIFFKGLQGKFVCRVFGIHVCLHMTQMTDVSICLYSNAA